MSEIKISEASANLRGKVVVLTGTSSADLQWAQTMRYQEARQLTPIMR